MASEPAVTSSRRALLAGSLGALTAFAAQALGRPLSTRASDGDPVLAGRVNSATVDTVVSTTTGAGLRGMSSAAGGIGVSGESTNASGFGVRALNTAPGGVALSAVTESNGIGVFVTAEPAGTGAATGVYSSVGDATAVYAENKSSNPTVDAINTGDGPGVHGWSEMSDAIYGVARSLGHAGVLGANESQTGGIGYGVLGVTNNTTPGTGFAGVEGRADYGFGVRGKTNHGAGVRGETDDAASVGVHGVASSGLGVQGSATSGKGGSFDATTGVALHARGRVELEQASGTATIAAGTRFRAVTPGFDLTTSTKVLVTLMGNPGAWVVLHRVAVDPVADTFTVHLTANAVAATQFAWLALV